MKKSNSLWGLWGFAFVSLLGTLLHFLYEWTGEATWAAVFSGVNESTWEHMKLLFVPMLLFAVAESRFFRNREDFWCIKLGGMLLGLTLIPVLFYTYNGAVGKSPDFLNIAIFFLSAAVVYIYETRKLNEKPLPCTGKGLSIAIICVIGVLFVIFTFLPPQIGLFRDPVTGTYGL